MIGGDPEDIRRYARSLSARAAELRADAAQPVQNMDVTWEGSAKNQFMQRVARQHGDISAAADKLDDLAAKTYELANTLQSRQEQIRALIAAAERARDAAIQEVHDAADAVGDAISAGANAAADTFDSGVKTLGDWASKVPRIGW